MPAPILVRLPGPLIAPESVALLPLVSKVPPAACSVIGRALVILAPANCMVPPVNTGPGEPVGPEASVQVRAPEVLALKVSPAASNALPLEQMPRTSGESPTGRVATTVLVAMLMTETVLFAAIGHIGEGAVRSDHDAGRLSSDGDGGDHRIGGGVDDGNIVGESVGDIGAGAVGSDRDDLRGSEKPSGDGGDHRIGGGVDDGNIVAASVGDIDAGAVGSDRYAGRINSDGDGGDHRIGRGVDDGNRVGICIGHIDASAVGSDRCADRLASDGDGGDHRIGRGVDDGNSVAALVGHVGAGAVGTERDEFEGICRRGWWRPPYSSRCSGLRILRASSTPGTRRYSPANTRRSMLLKAAFLVDLRCRMLSSMAQNKDLRLKPCPRSEEPGQHACQQHEKIYHRA